MPDMVEDSMQRSSELSRREYWELKWEPIEQYLIRYLNTELHQCLWESGSKRPNHV